MACGTYQSVNDTIEGVISSAQRLVRMQVPYNLKQRNVCLESDGIVKVFLA
jgi:hypothetical protein